jgi:O-acetyl-ADP-ribose deacetylase (regulator of RNase III)
MISHIHGNDILASGAEALVNPVNCYGVMGKGLARQFDKKFPDNTKKYALACRKKQLQPGGIFLFDRYPEPVADLFSPPPQNPRWIVNFATKDHWRGRSRIEWIASGLGNLVPLIRKNGIRSVAVPALGCGFGGLDWGEVRALVERTFDNDPGICVELYSPSA